MTIEQAIFYSVSDPSALKNFRRKAGLTQEELAEILGKSQPTVSRIEENAMTSSFADLRAFLEACGVGVPVSKGIDPGRPYDRLFQQTMIVEKYLKSWNNEFPTSIGPNPPTPSAFLADLSSLIRKPYVAISGSFDSGKTTIASELTGSKGLPTGYTPLTSCLTFIRHIEDRPDGYEHEVYILDGDFDPKSWDQLEHVNKHLVQAGTFDLLRTHGIHPQVQPRERRARTAVKETTKAWSSLVGKLTPDSSKQRMPAPVAPVRGKFVLAFMDAPVLHACTIVDPPGIASGELFDAELAGIAGEYMDVLIYLAPVAGFFNEKDFIHFPSLMKRLPVYAEKEKINSAFCNMLIVATHASGNYDQMEAMLDTNSIRMFNHISDHVDGVLTVRENIIGTKLQANDFRRRMFLYQVKDTFLAGPLFGELERMLSKDIPSRKLRLIEEQVKALRNRTNTIYQHRIAELEAALRTHAEAKEILKKLEEQEPVRQRDIADKQAAIRRRIYEYITSCQTELPSRLARYSNAGYLESLIRDQRFPDKSEAENRIKAIVMEKAQQDLRNVIKPHADDLDNELRKFTAYYQTEYLTMETKSGRVPAFEAKDVIVVAGGGAVAAFGVGILAGAIALPIAPIIAIGMVVTGLAFAIVRLFQDWEERLAENLVEQLEKSDFVGAFVESGDQYWRITGRSVEKAFSKLEEDYIHYKTSLRELLGADPETNLAALKKSIEACQRLKSFFLDMPELP